MPGPAAMPQQPPSALAVAQGTQTLRGPAVGPALAATQGMQRLKRPAAAAGHGPRPSITLPAGLQAHLSQWGPQLREAVMHVATSSGLARGLAHTDLRIGTDCSGAEAPILALRALGIRHRHVFSCESNPRKREYITANSPEAILFPDMLGRDHSTLPHHNVYVCGFPCTPFSSLHKGSRLLRDPNARPFFAMLATLQAALPQLAILENVLGIRQVMAKVWKHIQRLRWYEALTFLIDPADMGEPVRRPRYYFVLIRSDVAAARGRELHRLAAALAGVGLKPAGETRLSQRLLPTAAPYVQSRLATLASRAAPATRRGQARAAPAATRGNRKGGHGQQWVAKHAQHPHAKSAGTLAGMVAGLSCRQRSLLGIVEATAGAGQAHFNADVSQGLGRARPMQLCPTVTPRGLIVVGELGRLMSPMEKLLVHLLPVHSLKLPPSLTDRDIADLGGNTMHLMAVAGLVREGCEKDVSSPLRDSGCTAGSSVQLPPSHLDIGTAWCCRVVAATASLRLH